MKPIVVTFPIMPHAWDIGVPVVPFMFVATAREQIERNHSQTLERLKERGGLDWAELMYGLRGQSLSAMFETRPNGYDCAQEVMRRLAEWLAVTPLIELHGWRPR